MKTNILNIICWVIVLNFCSCLNYDTQFEGDYNAEEESNTSNSVVFVLNGDVYLSNPFLKDSTLIASGDHTLASINNNHTKVLFKSPDQNINVYDIASKSITEEIANTQNAFWFDYHSNNETVYYLIGNEIFTHGKSLLDKSPLNLAELIGLQDANTTIGSAVIKSNKDIVFSANTNSDGYSSTFVYLYKNDQEEDENAFPWFNSVTMVNFPEDIPLKNFRLSYDDIFFWGINPVTNQLQPLTTNNTLVIQTPTENVKMGTPINRDNGIILFSNNNINAFNQEFVTSFTGNISSIDF